MRSPLPLVALLYAAGLVLARAIPAPLPALFCLAFAAGLLALWTSRLRLASLCLFVPLTAWTNYLATTSPLSPLDLRFSQSNRVEYVTIRGTLSQAPVLRISERAGRLTRHSIADIQVEALRRTTQFQPAFGLVTSSTPELLPDSCFAGQKVEVTGVLQPPKGPTAPGQFDYRAYLQDRGIYYQLKCESTNDWQLAQSESGATKPPWADRFCTWGQRVMARGLPSEDESLRLLWAMVLGWKTALTQEVAEPFMQSGTLVDLTFRTTVGWAQ